ncbi:hypothetical protein, partial [Streptomyces sp. NPDC003483]
LQLSPLPVRQIPSRHTMIIAIQDPLSQHALVRSGSLLCSIFLDGPGLRRAGGTADHAAIGH